MRLLAPKVLTASLFAAGVTGLSNNVLNQYVDPELWVFWLPTRLAPIFLALAYMGTLKRAQSPLMDAFIILPAVATTLFIESLSLAPQIPWLIGLPLSYQTWAAFFWISLTAALCANHIRESTETTQPLDYARRSLLSLALLGLIAIWLLPAMGDTLNARMQRWLEAFQSDNLQHAFAHHSEITFWLETVGIAATLLLFLVQTALLNRSKPQHRMACITTVFGILFWAALRNYSSQDSLSLLSLSFRNTLVFMATAIIAARTASSALLYWHLPIPLRPENHPPSIRAQQLAARMSYEEDTRKPPFRKNVKRLVDRCHRALDKEASSKGISPALWIPHRLQAGIQAESTPAQAVPTYLGRARELENYLARGRRLEIIFCTWLLILGLAWSEWKAHNPFIHPELSEQSIFKSEQLWRSGLSAGLLNKPLATTASQKLAKTLAPSLKQDILWKLHTLQDIHGMPDTKSIFETIKACDAPAGQANELNCTSAHLLEPLVLTALDTLEQAEKIHRDYLGPSFRAPQIIRDLLPDHPDASALEISRIVAGQLASLDERFMARTGLFAMILAAHEMPNTKSGIAANLTLNLLAPPEVLLTRLNEDTRRLTARAQTLYTVVFGSPPYYRGQNAPSISEQKDAQDP